MTYMNEYITNFVKVFPDKGIIKVYRAIGKVNLGLLTKVINMHVEDLVASFLSTDYNNMRAGVYITSIGDHVNEEELRIKITEAIEKYQENQIARNLLVSENLNISNIEIEHVFDIPSTAYVVVNLLNNALRKKVPKEFWCPRRPGERFSLCFDIDLLEKKFWSRDPQVVNKDQRFIDFCREHPGLCRDTGDSCSKFFRVVKCLTLRFQHIVSDNEEIYLVLHHYYRRLSNLNLKLIIDHMKSNDIDLSRLLNVLVNYKADRSNTRVCEIASFTNDDELILVCGGEKIYVDLNKLDEISISVNPTYNSSRRFIEEYLCKMFDKHRDLNKFYPSGYFAILENDVEIVREIVNTLYIGEVHFSLDRNLKRVWES